MIDDIEIGDEFEWPDDDNTLTKVVALGEGFVFIEAISGPYDGEYFRVAPEQLQALDEGENEE